MENNKAIVKTAKIGFAKMSPEQRSEIARKGGLAVSQNRKHMSEIGLKGVEIKKKKLENVNINQE